MFELAEDMVLKIGKDAGELNLIILIPKTEKRANGNDVSLNKLLQSRTQNNAVLETLSESYRGKNSIRTRGLTIKLVARRSSDGYVSKKKFDFVYLPHDYYDPCFFCYENPDNNPESSRAKLVPMKEVARPGLRKRQMSDTVDLTERKIIIRGDDHNIRIENMNRLPVIKTNSTIPTTLQRILPIPSLKLVPVSQLQNVRIDSSNNVEETIIKTEPVEEPEPSTIPFHDISKKTIRTFPMAVVSTTPSNSSFIYPIKKEL